MALKGNLSNFTITQLLNLINLAQKTGTLIVEGSEETIAVSFKSGKLAYAHIRGKENSLGAILLNSKRVSNNQFKVLRQRSGNMNDKELGLLLVNANYLTQQDIILSLQSHYLRIIKKLFTWKEGGFRFENNMLPPDDKISVRINLENIILEGSRRMREWEQLKDEIPSLEMTLRFVDRPSTNIRSLKLSSDEWKVISFINPKNSIQQIGRATNLSELEIRRVVYSLLQAGLVEFIRPEGMKPPQREQTRFTAPQASPKEQKSLINRIIQRIRSL